MNMRTGMLQPLVLAVVLAGLASGCPTNGSGSTSSSGDPGTTSSSGGTSTSSSGGSSGSSGSSGGGVGAGCDSTHPCGAFRGSPLECTNGACALPGCPTGTLGCPCNGTTCEATAMCQTDVCAAAGCTAGQPGCVCAADMCNGGTQCVAGFCRYPTRLGLRVEDASVRACDVLLQETSRPVQSVAFSAGVLGEQVRRGKKWALSFTRRTDEAGLGAAATLEFGGMTPVAPTDVQVLTSRCYDASGSAVAQPGVSLQ